MLLNLFTAEETLEKKVTRVQLGNEELRNLLIQKYRPFIKKAVSKACKKFISSSHEEYSIGLIAFNEAIDKFNSEENYSFLSFANLVIKRRIIDYIRKDQAINEISLSETNFTLEDTSSEHYAIVQNSLEVHKEKKKSEDIKEDIVSFKSLLSEFGISFEKLTEVSPKHQDTKDLSREIARLIADSPTIREKLYSKKRLPITDLLPLVKVKKKTLERNRIYIISLTIVMVEDLTFLKEFLR